MIYFIEDDKSINEAIFYTLKSSGFEVMGFEKPSDFWQAVRENIPKLIILDIMLPEEDGLHILRKLRDTSATKDIPIIMLTAKTSEYDKVIGLDSGADDYMTKPFLPLELVARVKAQLRRYKRYNTAEEKDEEVLSVSGLVLNIKTHQCTLNEKELNLTPTEFSILRILCQRKGQVVSAEELFHLIWADEYYTKNNNTITVHIRHLREKMGDSFESPKYIKTVWGCGYKIEG